jgi:hypothetical protein
MPTHAHADRCMKGIGLYHKDLLLRCIEQLQTLHLSVRSGSSYCVWLDHRISRFLGVGGHRSHSLIKAKEVYHVVISTVEVHVRVSYLQRV